MGGTENEDDRGDRGIVEITCADDDGVMGDGRTAGATGARLGTGVDAMTALEGSLFWGAVNVPF